MTDAEELELLELEAKSKGWSTPSPKAEPGIMSQVGDVVSGLGTGAKHALQKTSAGLTGAAAWLGGDYIGKPLEKTLLKYGLTPSQQQLEQGAKDTAAAGVPGTIGQVGTDIATSILPMAKAAQAMKAGAAATPILGDIAASAGYGAATTPGGFDERATGAAWGAVGAGGGRVAGRIIGGPARPLMSPEAKTLVDAGVQLTPGQMVSGEKAGWIAKSLRGLEDKATSIPFIGDVIKHGQEGSLKSWATTEVNDALKHIGTKTKETGLAAIEDAHQKISSAYDNVLPDIKVPVVTAAAKIKQVVADASNIDLFDAGHMNKLETFVERAIDPLLAKGTDLSGSVAKKMDARIGELARRMSGSEGNKPLGEAFRNLQSEWRASMEGTTQEAKDVLQGANAAFRKLLPLEEASTKTMSGQLTPSSVKSAAQRLKMEPTGTAAAARQVLPSTVPDSGTAGRQILHSILTPSAVGAGAAGAAGMGMLPTAALAAVPVAAAYTKPGSKYLSGAYTEDLLKALRGKISVNELEDITRLLTSQGIRAAGTGD